MRERGQHHQQHLGTLTGVSINHRKFFSSSIAATTQHKGWSIINISTRLRVFSTRLASQHEVGYTISSTRSWHHSTRLATQHHQHEAGITVRDWQHNITARSWNHSTRLATHHHNTRLTHHTTRLATHHHSTRLATHHHARG
jgi:hypothetical protein